MVFRIEVHHPLEESLGFVDVTHRDRAGSGVVVEFRRVRLALEGPEVTTVRLGKAAELGVQSTNQGQPASMAASGLFEPVYCREGLPTRPSRKVLSTRRSSASKLSASCATALPGAVRSRRSPRPPPCAAAR